MLKVIVHKAIPTGGPTPDLIVSASDEIPPFKTLEEQDAFCGEEAKELEEALLHTLPGATYDRLLVFMLQRKTSHFRVLYSR